MKRLFSWLVIFGLGTWFGAWLFRDVQPRTWLPVHGATLRSSSAELLGYLGSAATQHAPGLVPGVVLETDKSIAMKYPVPWESEGHFVVVPKRDIRDIGMLAKGDEPYLIDAFAVIGKLARQQGMKNYWVTTAGPDQQHVRYLHFHLVSKGAATAQLDTLRVR